MINSYQIKLPKLVGSFYRNGKTWADLNQNDVSYLESLLGENAERNISLYNILQFKKRINFKPNPYSLVHTSGTQRKKHEFSEPEISKHVRVFPNPTSGLVKVEFANNNGQDYLVTIMNLTGQALQSKQSNDSNIIEIDASALANGLYLVVISSANKIISTEKLSISK